MNKATKFNSKMMVTTLCVAAAGLLAAQGQDHGPSSITEDRNNQPQEQTAATSRNNQDQTATLAEAGQPMKINRCSKLIGTEVENQQGDKLGKIEDVVVDFSNGKVSYCVLKVEHSVFATPKYLAVPLSAFQPNGDGSRLLLNADKDKLAQAQGFERNNWPSVTSPSWGAPNFWQQPGSTSTGTSSSNQYKNSGTTGSPAPSQYNNNNNNNTPSSPTSH